MNMLRRVCVFCGSNTGFAETPARAAAQLGTRLAENGIGLVYGGASVGLMGTLADAALAAGGEVIGVLPRMFEVPALVHTGLTRLVIANSMHERKATMAELADAFIALPGGLGTFEELLEALTWNQLGLHHKPVGVLNVGGFFDPLIEQFNRAVTDGFLKSEHRELLVVEDDAARLLERLRQHRPTTMGKWLDR